MRFSIRGYGGEVTLEASSVKVLSIPNQSLVWNGTERKRDE